MERNYVYLHRHPQTKQVFYVGHGTLERAWIVRHGKGGAGRSKEHADYLIQLMDEGYYPHDWVEIVQGRLTKSQACCIEQDLIRQHKTLFNKPQGLSQLRMTSEMFQVAKSLREKGHSYKDVGASIGFSTMGVYRSLNKRNKNIVDE